MNFNIIKTWLPGIFLISVMAPTAMLWGGLALIAVGGGATDGGSGGTSPFTEPPDFPSVP